MIDGVILTPLKQIFDERGKVMHMLREDSSVFSRFGEIYFSCTHPGVVKAWHLHYKQEDVWYVPPEDHMILGMWDLRNDSDTKDVKMKVVLGNGTSKLVYVPRGVAHGVVNISKKSGDIWYFVNGQFNFSDPDEQRLKWDAAGADFWEVKKE